MLFEPLEDKIVSRPAPWFRVREAGHARNGGVFAPGAQLRLHLEGMPWCSRGLAVRIVLRRVAFDSELGRPSFPTAGVLGSVAVSPGLQDASVQLPADLESGMYLLDFVNPVQERVAMPVYVSAAQGAPVAGAVIVPTFTVWGYDETSGFYPGHGRPLVDRRVHQLAKLGLTGWALGTAARVGLKRAFGVHLNQPKWPVHKRVNLHEFFGTNHRWSKWLWDPELGRTNGIWNDDVDITIPFFALAARAGARFRIYSDIDVHRQATELAAEKRLVFLGQESLTTQYWEMLKRHLDGGGEAILWCPQGFGYRQVRYDLSTGELEYVCSRGRRGFWNEALEQEDPPWDEGSLFGFRFPSPDSADATNPHKRQYGKMLVQADVSSKNHIIPKGTEIPAVVWDGRAWRPGYNWLGGEPFRRVLGDAQILVSMSDDPEVIGYGRFNRTAVVSPTFLGALWAYGHLRTPLVEAIFEQLFTDRGPV